MAGERGAFAVLLSNRCDELGLAPTDLADELELSTTEVDDWLSGATLPEDDTVEPLARALSLPRSLLREAIRRTDLPAAQPEDDLSAEPPLPMVEAPVLDVPPADSTLEQPIPVATSVIEEIEIPDEPGLVDRFTERFGGPFRALQDRVDRQRSRSRAPTRTPSYIEDDQQRMTYRWRATFTVGGVLVLVIVLRWAFGGLGDALSDLWDTLIGAL